MRFEMLLAKGCFTAGALIAGLATTGAQSGNRPHPADPGAAVPALEYESAFSNYQHFREQEGNAWKQVNKEVAENPPGMDSKNADAMNKEGHDMKQMKK